MTLIQFANVTAAFGVDPQSPYGANFLNTDMHVEWRLAIGQ